GSGCSIGIVLPRTALAGAGSAPWRELILEEGRFRDVTLLLNNRGWVFEDVHPQYTVALVSVRRTTPIRAIVTIRGPFSNPATFAAGTKAGVSFDVEEFRSWSEGAAFPLLPSERS